MKVSVFWLAALAFVTAVACTPAFHSTSGIPRPGATMPYGLLVLDIELGDTTGAELVFTATGYVSRRVPVRADGVMVLRMNRGDWTVQLEGRPGRSKVVTFDKEDPTLKRGSKVGIKRWPESKYSVTIQRNKLTAGGKICAHSGCASQWSDFDDPMLDEWMRASRLLLTTPVFGEPEAKEPPESGDEEAEEEVES